MKKRKTINIRPDDVQLEYENQNTFVLQFYDDKKVINIEMRRWWIKYIAECLHRVIKAEQKRLDDLKKAMAGQL